MAVNIDRASNGTVTFDFGGDLDPIVLSDSNDIVVSSEETKDSVGSIIRQDISFMRSDPYFFYSIAYSQIGTINGEVKPDIGADTTTLLEDEVFQGTSGDAFSASDILAESPVVADVESGLVTISIEPGEDGEALVTEGGVTVWGNQTASSVGAVATNMVGVANGVASLGAGGFVPVGQLPNATGAARGVVLQGTAQADSVAADVPAMVVDFNALLAKLRTAGILAT